MNAGHFAMKRLIAILAGISPLFASAHGETLVVQRALGMDLAQEAELDGTKPLILKQGQVLSLMRKNGRFVTLRGPWQGVPQQQPDVAKQIAVGLATVDRGAANAVLPEPWVINANRSGNACLLRGSPVRLWRLSAATPDEVIILASDGSWSARLDWPASLHTLEIPTGIQMFTGDSYTISLGKAAASITLIDVPPVLTDTVMQDAWMRSFGCNAQADALERTGGRATQ